jgi:hypothetical protein
MIPMIGLIENARSIAKTFNTLNKDPAKKSDEAGSFGSWAGNRAASVDLTFFRFLRECGIASKPEAHHHPPVCGICASSIPATARPFIAPARSALTSSNTLGSLKCELVHL